MLLVMTHLRYAGLDQKTQENALKEIIETDPVLMELLTGLRDLDFPDWWLVSGAIYNNVWNHLTQRTSMEGVKDFDVFYFDDADLSYVAEDKVIKRAETALANLPLPVEVRNQARVHLWAPEKFGHNFAPLTSSLDMLDKFASKTHAVAVKLNRDGRIEIFAPFGLDDIFSFSIVPNYALANRKAHEAKGERALEFWPELTVLPWVDDQCAKRQT